MYIVSKSTLEVFPLTSCNFLGDNKAEVKFLRVLHSFSTQGSVVN